LKLDMGAFVTLKQVKQNPKPKPQTRTPNPHPQPPTPNPQPPTPLQFPYKGDIGLVIAHKPNEQTVGGTQQRFETAAAKCLNL